MSSHRHEHCRGPFGGPPAPLSPEDAGSMSRRHWITNVAGGMGAWALLSLLEREGHAAGLACGPSRRIFPAKPRASSS
jgi:hypothetical protein